MKKFLVTGIALSSLLIFAGSASAADPLVESAYDWTGLYAGVYGGYAFGDWQANGDDGAFDEAGPEDFDLSPAGGVVGVTAGYNWQVDQLVLGVEGEVGYNFADDSRFVVPSPDNFGTVDYGMYGTLAARLGWAADNMLLFGKIGGVLADIDNRAGDLVDGSSDIDPADLGRSKETAFGLLLGAGIEYGLAESWSVKAEYNFMAFEDSNDTNSQGDQFEFENQIHVVKAGVNFNF